MGRKVYVVTTTDDDWQNIEQVFERRYNAEAYVERFCRRGEILEMECLDNYMENIAANVPHFCITFDIHGNVLFVNRVMPDPDFKQEWVETYSTGEDYDRDARAWKVHIFAFYMLVFASTEKDAVRKAKREFCQLFNEVKEAFDEVKEVFDSRWRYEEWKPEYKDHLQIWPGRALKAANKEN